MKFKYIMLEKTLGEKDCTVQHIPVLFFEPLTHLGMWESMQRNREMRGLDLVSAGFVYINGTEVACEGYSESLKTAGEAHVPLPQDAETIKQHPYMHGIQ